MRCVVAGAAAGCHPASRPHGAYFDDGRGHPFAFHRSVFGDLAALHGDKGVWKLLDRRAADVVEVPVPGRVPIDVDTEDDYAAVVAAAEGA